MFSKKHQDKTIFTTGKGMNKKTGERINQYFEWSKHTARLPNEKGRKQKN